MKQFLLALCLLTLVACKSPERTIFITASSIGSTADAAIGAFDTYRQSHPLTPAQLASARQAVQAYVNAMEVMRGAVTAYKAGTGSKDSADIALNAAQAASASVVALLNTLTTAH